MAETLTRDTFAPHLNSQFHTYSDTDKLVTLELVEVTELHILPASESFSVVFRGPADVLLQQATYRLTHENLGSLDIFIVPVARLADGLYYEAVFNRYRR